MLILERKKHGVLVTDCWYADEDIKKKGLIQYHESIKPIGKKIRTFETLVSDLTQSPEEIIACYSKSCKYKVNRAPREGVEIRTIEKKDITDQDIRDFVQFYEEFYESKGYGTADKKHMIDEMCRYRDASALSIHIAYVKNEPIVYHTHILSDHYARLYHSVSLYRVIEDVPTTVIGMANRYLHKEDMLIFKDMGIDTYDWGGAGHGEDVANITEFKESFGGKRINFYHGEQRKGMKAFLYSCLLTILNKF